MVPRPRRRPRRRRVRPLRTCSPRRPSLRSEAAVQGRNEPGERIVEVELQRKATAELQRDKPMQSARTTRTASIRHPAQRSPAMRRQRRRLAREGHLGRRQTPEHAQRPRTHPVLDGERRGMQEQPPRAPPLRTVRTRRRSVDRPSPARPAQRSAAEGRRAPRRGRTATACASSCAWRAGRVSAGEPDVVADHPPECDDPRVVYPERPISPQRS